MSVGSPLLRVDSLRKSYGGVVALDGPSFDVVCGEFLSVVGESGSGKSTLLRCLAALELPDSGVVCLGGIPLTQLRGQARREFCRSVQLVLQDAATSMNPRWDALSVVREPLDILRRDLPLAERDRIVCECMRQVGLDTSLLHRLPLELSGGQRQRLQLARAITLGPSLLLLDEPLSGLDAPIQLEILNLIQRLRSDHSLTCILVTHDLEVAWSASSSVAILWQGQLIARFTPGQDLWDPQRLPALSRHPYATALVEKLWQRSGTFAPAAYIKTVRRTP